MKKALATAALLIWAQHGLAQGNLEATQLAQPQLPDITLASPTVAALMKFEEVPVSEYTGIPSVSIPIHNENIEGSLTLGVSLSYHPSGSAVAELASWTGTGWSLEAGGSVSRVVKGNPDESTSSWTPGIYTSNFENIYDMGLFKDGTLNILNAAENEKLLWEGMNPKEATRDTQYDLYQYNFMGYSGRFIVTKTGEVIQGQQDSPLKINLVAGTQVTITNEYGYTFVFSVKEITSTLENLTTGTYQMGAGSYSSAQEVSGGRLDDPFASSYHLRSIKKEDRVLVLFDYVPVTETYRTPRVITRNNLDYGIPQQSYFTLFPENRKGLLMLESINQKKMSIVTQKLSKITVYGKCIIDFQKLDGRPEYLDNTGTKLTDIVVKNIQGNRTKRFHFEYSSQGAGSRLFLDYIQQYGTQDSSPLRYNLTYDRPELLPTRFSNNVDFWGYYNGAINTVSFPKSPRDGMLSGANREVNTNYLTVGMLKSLQYPTGGKLLLAFESNTASYQGSTPLGKEEIPENMVPDTSQYIAGTGNYTFENPWTYVYADFNQSVEMNMIITNFPSVSLQHTENFMYEFIPIMPPPGQTGPIYNYATFIEDTSRPTFSISLSETWCADSYCTFPVTMKKGTYKVRLRPKVLKLESMTTINYGLSFSLYKYVWNQRFTKGGGVRIASLQYTDRPKNPQDLLAPDQILKTKEYNYQEPGDATMSSGSFAFDFPRYYYQNTVNTAIATSSSIVCSYYSNFDITYKTYTNFNNHNPLKTKGSDIGYRYVKVSEQGNGHILHNFTSPIDFPEDPYVSSNFPFTSGRNLDYKRGLKKNEKVYDKDGKILKEVVSDYDYLEKFPIIGITAVNLGSGCGSSRLFAGYSEYLAAVGQNTVCKHACGMPSTKIGFAIEKPASGWAQLREQQTKEYFYVPGSTLASVLTERMNYTYNTVNKKVKTIEKTDADGRVTKLVNYYPDDIASASSLSGGSLTTTEMSTINLMKAAGKHHTALPVQVESYTDGQLSALQRTGYKDWGAGLLSAETVQHAKAPGALEYSIRYNAMDNSTGNPLEVQQQDGMKICYIWGYNGTVPVAKIENIAYSAIPAALISAVQAQSNASVTGLEPALLTALDNLRSAPALAGALVTTMTYVPLVGAKVLTDPKGIRTTYDYDEMGRLKGTKDHQGNILSENQYHYRSQN